MKYRVIIILLAVFFSWSAPAQDYIKHKVAKKETVADIARKYKVTPFDIYRLNPDSKNGIKENSILLVPKKVLPQQPESVPEKTTKIANTRHKVGPGETLYSIAKKYNVSFDDIKKANQDAGDALKVGQEVIIPVKGSPVAAQVKEARKAEAKTPPPSYFYHTVAPGETKYSIAKQYGMTLQLLEALNPDVKDTLPVGYRLKLDKNSVLVKETQPAVPVPPAPPASQKTYLDYQVQPKETLYSLSKRANLTEEELIALNPEMKEGLREGMVIKMPVGSGAGAPGAKTVADLSKDLKKSAPKEIALLLPFNLPKSESDTTRISRLKSEKFLNMTLDFYAGALMAIDSARTLGVPVKVKIYDSKETRTSSDVASLKSSLSTTDAVIGPFFQGNVESAAAALGNIPVISPLSKESGKAYGNLYQSVPSEESVKVAMLDYLRSKNANIIAIVDSKKLSSRQLIKRHSPEVKFLEGAVTDATLKAMLDADRPNYLIMETENVTMILNTTKVLENVSTGYTVQLAVLEKTDALENTEVPVSRLAGLKMLYPSVTNDGETPEMALFSKVFRQKNGIAPNQFATRGFDVTFDVIMRVFQEEGFAAATSKATEYVENKFSYETSETGNYNTAVYIMQYNPDLTITQAK
ncbi:hypothetical protein CHU92_14020 [Flavobacterium cyanobacteriorum]|uniref:LysM domain-containing protein n=1 Tax=Flavobacterium cyanobacteriorum TaxID=2022802 RepID=A0A255YUZ7_9FLAO|nr:LysM peptidoglycan-binding domain-containing protein [Flavobacterium cyanobacteriorum]OYQ33032.1 hypothetical protein CHU92_14020 [Flavobacterium cyanobacteriorum]